MSRFNKTIVGVTALMVLTLVLVRSNNNSVVGAFSSIRTANTPPRRRQTADNNNRPLMYLSKSWNDGHASIDPNTWWVESSDTEALNDEDDWETKLKKQQDGSYWSGFELPTTTTATSQDGGDDVENNDDDDDDESDAMLDKLATIQADEVTFNIREAQRADTQRQMEEWGFDRNTIASTLNVSMIEEEEVVDDDAVKGMQGYREASYLDFEDLRIVESHTKVPKDPNTNEPIRNQMVYVDEHACIGCTNCAMIAQSTFFMEEENGRARVFEQWGDDDNTIRMAIETCPVDCIHYVPYDELVQLEVRRRDQYINVLAGLASRAERGAGSSGLMSSTPRSFGSRSFTDAPKISRTYYNDSSSNENSDLKAKEQLRLLKARIRNLEEERRRNNKIVDL